MKTRNRYTTGRPVPIALAALVSILALVASGALAAKGGPKNTQAVAVTYDDFADDGIGSDGEGAYDGLIDENGDLVVKATKGRSVYFDFSDCAIDYVTGVEGCITPFGIDGSGLLQNVTLTVPGAAGPVGTTTEVQALFELVAANAKWRIWTSVVVSRLSDGNGGVRYDLRSAADSLTYVSHFAARGGGGGYWTTTSAFALSWGADAVSP